MKVGSDRIRFGKVFSVFRYFRYFTIFKDDFRDHNKTFIQRLSKQNLDFSLRSFQLQKRPNKTQ